MPKQVPGAPSAPDPVGPYSVVTEAGGLVFISGQIAIDPATGDLVAGDVAAEAERVLDNLTGILSDLGLGWPDVAKATIYLADMGDFPVVNEVYARYAGSPAPARATVEVSGLPKGVQVEIELIAAR
jgi:2-iminobutanoate/2-iminopropanoate deaminase